MSDTAKWVKFVERPAPAGRLTKEWAVVAKQNGDVLGIIDWYGQWRKYVFEPRFGTVYEQDCLRDIATFCESQTRQQKERAKERKLSRTR
jgi:hypothetical protein